MTLLSELSSVFPFIPLEELVRVSDLLRVCTVNKKIDLDMVAIQNNTGLPTEQIGFFLRVSKKVDEGLKDEISILEGEIEDIEAEITKLERERKVKQKELGELPDPEPEFDGLQISLYELIK